MNLFPKADEKDKLGEWTIDPNFLESVKEHVFVEDGIILKKEIIELFLLAAECLIKADETLEPDCDAYLTIDSTGKHHVHLGKMSDSTMQDWNITSQHKLFKSPPRKPLSDEEIDRTLFICKPGTVTSKSLRDFARRIEKAHGIK